MSLHQITDHIWLGSIMSLHAVNELKEANVTHVLSLLSPPNDSTDPRWKSLPLFANIEHHLNVEIDDVEDVDIMKYFDETNAFIAHAVAANQGVLVHCAAGISRSVTCVCAYLMKTRKWDVDTAIEFVRSKRAVANPNSGYLEQLEIYYKSGFEANDNSKLYREWKLKNTDARVYTHLGPQAPSLTWEQVIPAILRSQTETQLASEGTPQQLEVNEVVYASVERVKVPPTDPIHFVIGEADFFMDQTKLRTLLNQMLSRSTGFLRCKGCSTKLATTNSVVTHELGGQGPCQHYFIEPVEWMRPELERGELEGKLSCPKCDKKTGSYVWHGSRCTCGTWITPSIKLSKAKVDGMGLPPLL